jgi:hypothetical protein
MLRVMLKTGNKISVLTLTQIGKRLHAFIVKEIGGKFSVLISNETGNALGQFPLK